MYKKFSIMVLAIILSVLFTMQDVSAQEKFPTKPVKMIITHGVGGSVDIPSRGMAQYMQKYVGVPVVCENMEGAGGRRAMEYAFNQAKPDGYTMVSSAFPSRLIGELLYNPKYKMKDFMHLGSWVGGDYRTVIVAKNSAFKSFKDIVEESKKKKLTVAGGGGLGSTSQLQFVYLKEVMKLNVDLVPYNSDAEVTAATLGGHTDFGVAPLSGALRIYRTGETRIVAIHAPKRLKEIPEVPTMKELGFEGVVIPYGVGGWAPPNTPKDRVKILSDAIIKASKDSDFIKWAEKSSVMLEPLGPDEFYKTTMEDYNNITKVLPLLKTAK